MENQYGYKTPQELAENPTLEEQRRKKAEEHESEEAARLATLGHPEKIRAALKSRDGETAEHLFEEYLKHNTFNGVQFSVVRYSVAEAAAELSRWLGTEDFHGRFAFDPGADTFQTLKAHGFGDEDSLLCQRWTCGIVEACMTQEWSGFVPCDSLTDFMEGRGYGFAEEWEDYRDSEPKCAHTVEVWVCDDWSASCQQVTDEKRADAINEFDLKWESMSEEPESFDGWAVAAEGKNKLYMPSEREERIGESIARDRFYTRRKELGVGSISYEEALGRWLEERGFERE